MNLRLWREIGLTLLLAVVLGVGYSYFTKQGFFAPKNSGVQPDIKTISLMDAKAAFDSHAATFIDARHDFEFAQGHIHGAVNIPLTHFDQSIHLVDQFLKSDRFILYCDGVACNSSIELAVKLTERGFTHIEVFFGGWQDWTNAGYPVEQSPTQNK